MSPPPRTELLTSHAYRLLDRREPFPLKVTSGPPENGCEVRAALAVDDSPPTPVDTPVIETGPVGPSNAMVSIRPLTVGCMYTFSCTASSVDPPPTRSSVTLLTPFGTIPATDSIPGSSSL